MITDRTVRVFVSSTFRDMQAERDYLVKFAFPQLRKPCEVTHAIQFQAAPWLREHLHQRKSVTELEILHGVINNPEMADHSFFYFRDPKYLERLPSEQQKEFRAEDNESAGKLEMLKQRIRTSGFPAREGYADQKALGELVIKDFTELIDTLFPIGTEQEPLDRDAADHEAVAHARARVYIGRQE